MYQLYLVFLPSYTPVGERSDSSAWESKIKNVNIFKNYLKYFLIYLLGNVVALLLWSLFWYLNKEGDILTVQNRVAVLWWGFLCDSWSLPYFLNYMTGVYLGF